MLSLPHDVCRFTASALCIDISCRIITDKKGVPDMKRLNLLVKPASSLRNLRCKYCFYEDEAINRSQYSMGIMHEDLADTLIAQAFDAIDPDGTISFAFQGGEPTIAGLPFFEHFADNVRECRPSGVIVAFSIQTNGTLLNDEWAKFLKREHFLVGLSLDGFRDSHDAHRIDANGYGTWRKVLAAKGLLEKYGVDYNALCVVTKRCAAHPEQAAWEHGRKQDEKNQTVPVSTCDGAQSLKDQDL